jgi:hypothetical protein
MVPTTFQYVIISSEKDTKITISHVSLVDLVNLDSGYLMSQNDGENKHLVMQSSIFYDSNAVQAYER